MVSSEFIAIIFTSFEGWYINKDVVMTNIITPIYRLADFSYIYRRSMKETRTNPWKFLHILPDLGRKPKVDAICTSAHNHSRQHIWMFVMFWKESNFERIYLEIVWTNFFQKPLTLFIVEPHIDLPTNFLMYCLLKLLIVYNSSHLSFAVGRPIWSCYLDFWLTNVNSTSTIHNFNI